MRASNTRNNRVQQGFQRTSAPSSEIEKSSLPRTLNQRVPSSTLGRPILKAPGNRGFRAFCLASAVSAFRACKHYLSRRKKVVTLPGHPDVDLLNGPE